MRSKLRTERQDLTSGNVSRNIWRLAIPMMVGNLLQNTFSFVDMIFVGKLGPDAIAAVAMSGLILSMIFTLAIGISMGTVALVSRYTGARKLDAVEAVTFQSIWLSLASSVLVGVMGYLFAEEILALLGASSSVVAIGIPYIHISFIGSFTLFLSVVLSAALRGVGDAITPTKMLAGTTVMNIVLDPLLIFGVWFFPEMGVAGSALATVMTRGFGVLYLFRKCAGGEGLLHLNLRNAQWQWDTMKSILRIGVFGSMQALLRNLSGVVLMRIVAVYGTATVAAYGVGMRLQFMVMMPGFGIANAVATLVGQNLGAEKPERAKRTAISATLWGMGIMTVVGLGYIALAGPLIRIFNTDPEVVRQGTLYLRVTAGFVGCIGVSIILGRAFNGAGDTKSPMVITGIALFLLRIPLALLGAALYDEMGVFAGIAASTALQAVIMALWFRQDRWMHVKVD